MQRVTIVPLKTRRQAPMTTPHPFGRSLRLVSVGGPLVYRSSRALTLMLPCLCRELPPCIAPDHWLHITCDLLQGSREYSTGVRWLCRPQLLDIFLACSSWSSSGMSNSGTYHGRKNLAGIIFTCWLLNCFLLMHQQTVPSVVNPGETDLVAALVTVTVSSGLTN